MQSTVGVGTTFEIALPIYREAAQPEAAPQAAAVAAEGRRVARVLVAEDTEMLAKLIKAILTTDGHEVTSVSTTQDAIAALRGGKFDLVITDLLMPGGGGREVIAFSTSLDNSPPVLIVTGVTDVRAEHEAMEMGAAGYVRKPFTRAELNEAVDRLLSISQ